MATMLFDQNNEQIAKPASKVLMETAGFDTVDNQLCFIFGTSEGKRGYGKQAIPVSQLDACLEVLQEASDNGVQPEDYKPTTSEVINKSLILSKDGSVRFKTQSEKGKKPTFFLSERDFVGFVAKLGELLPHIKQKAQSIQDELDTSVPEVDEVEEEHEVEEEEG